MIVAAAAIWLKLNSGSPAPDVSLAPSSTPRRPLRKPVQQQPTPVQSQNVQPSQAQGSQVEKAKPAVAQPTETKPGPAVVKQVPVPNQKQPLPATSTAKIQSPAAKPDPLTLFNRGDYEAAGRAWKEELQKAGIRYAIFLELDCRAESLLLAYRQFKQPGDFFILNRQRNGHTCFLVLWGKFANKMAAEAAIPRLPSFFLKQPEQPEVIDLSRNL